MPRLLTALTTALVPLLLTSCVYWTPRSLTPSSGATVVTNVPVQKWDIMSCGAGALSSVLNHLGDTRTMDEWDATLPKTRGGVLSIDLMLAARERGFDAQLVTGDADLIDAELRAGRPVIAMLQVVQAPGKGYDFFHYIVIDGFDPVARLYRTQFGDAKSRWVRLDRIDAAWKATRYATIVIRPADPLAKSLRAAVELENEGKYALAADAYREIVRSNPSAVVAWTNLGNAESQMGRHAAAEEAFRRAIDADPQAADALNNLAWLLFQQNRIDDAEAVARRAVDAPAPDRWTRLDTLAQIVAARGDCAEARRLFGEALDQVPSTRTTDRAAVERASAAVCSEARR